MECCNDTIKDLYGFFVHSNVYLYFTICQIKKHVKRLAEISEKGFKFLLE